jgi:hypothetical protein
MKPWGSFLPGMRNLAITPTTNPMIIVQIMLIESLPHDLQGGLRESSGKGTFHP